MSDQKPHRPTEAQHPESKILDTSAEYDVDALHRDDLQEGTPDLETGTVVPLWLLALSMVVVFWAGAYLMHYNGEFKSDRFVEFPGGALPGEEAVGKLEEVPLTPFQLGEKHFKRNCVSCHQASGQGVPDQYPPLAGSEWVTNGNKRVVLIMLYGMNGPVQVLGNAYNGNMAAWSASLDDEIIAAIATYIRQSWGNQAGDISAEQVAKMRVEYAGHPQWTQQKLEEAASLDENIEATGGPAAALNTELLGQPETKNTN